MKFARQNLFLFLLGLIFFTGCFNHTLPTVKRLEEGEEMWGASVGFPFFSSQSQEAEESPSTNPAKEFSWSIWYGNGVSKNSDCYVYIGELGGIGVLVNSEVRKSHVSSVVLNYGIGTVNGIYGFRPRIGINYSDGKEDINGKKESTWKQVGFLTGIAYDLSENDPELTGDYELYGGLDQKKYSHFYFAKLGVQKINKFSGRFSEISKWGPKFLSYREWAKTPYHFNIEAGIGSIKK